MRKFIFIATGIVLFGLVAWGYYSYQKPHKDASGIAPSANVTAEELYKAYALNEDEANKKFLGKVISIQGIINVIQHDSGSVNILLNAGNNSPGSVNCSFPNLKLLKTLQANDHITIKGRCTGFLLDVNVVDCVIE